MHVLISPGNPRCLLDPRFVRGSKFKKSTVNSCSRLHRRVQSSKENCYGTGHSALASGSSNSGYHPHRSSISIGRLTMTILEITGLTGDETGVRDEASASAVSWSAVIAGAIVAVALSLILLLMGSGLGLTMVSPWSNSGVGPTTFAVSTAIWLIVVQWLSSALGGYLTGRLRTRWAGVHTDEVFFRDTAHGLLTWAVATVLFAGVLGSAASAIIAGGGGAATSLATGATQGSAESAKDRVTNAAGLPTEYFVDLMFRMPTASPAASSSIATIQNGAEARTEASRILVVSFASGSVSAADRSYLGQLVSTGTGRAAVDAQQRVDDVIAQIDQAKAKAMERADKARKVGITASLLMVLSLVIGAFVASAAAALGGRRRDEA
jgi:hypothetical protein